MLRHLAQNVSHTIPEIKGLECFKVGTANAMKKDMNNATTHTETTIRDFAWACRYEHARAVVDYRDDSAELWLDLWHDLDVALAGVRAQDWRGVIDTIHNVTAAIDGDWSWRIE